MPKRQRHSSGRGRTASKRPALERKQQYLYLVLDDWEKGYSIHRVDVDTFDLEPGFDSDSNLESRPRSPPLVRVEMAHRLSGYFTVHGTKILAMLPDRAIPGIPVFDTETMALTVCPWPNVHGIHRNPLFASVDDRLFALITPCFDVLGAQPPPDSEKPWSWTSIADSSRPPFFSDCISGYALHPDGRTIFVSVDGWSHVPVNSCSGDGDRKSTFSFDTESLEWTHHGEWLLPFKGQAHYDGELDAWVGLCRYGEDYGYLCSCDVPPVVGWDRPLIWKLGLDRMFRARSSRHRGATLVYMGNSKFCLVESRAHKDDEVLMFPRRRVLHMTTFGLKYDKEGDLAIAGHRARSSKFFETVHRFVDPMCNPVAFWI